MKIWPGSSEERVAQAREHGESSCLSMFWAVSCTTTGGAEEGATWAVVRGESRRKREVIDCSMTLSGGRAQEDGRKKEAVCKRRGEEEVRASGWER